MKSVKSWSNAILNWCFVMSPEEIKAFIRRHYEEHNKGKTAIMNEYERSYTNDIVFHAATGRDLHGINEIKQYMSEFLNAFPDMHFTIDDIFVEGDKVAVRYTLSGTHKGELWGVPPTNKKGTMWVIEISHIVGGKVVEVWARFDTLSFMKELGSKFKMTNITNA